MASAYTQKQSNPYSPKSPYSMGLGTAGSALGRYIGGSDYGPVGSAVGGYLGSVAPGVYGYITGAEGAPKSMGQALGGGGMIGLGGALGGYLGSKYGPLGAGLGSAAGQLLGYGASELLGTDFTGSQTGGIYGGIGAAGGGALGGYLGNKYGGPLGGIAGGYLGSSLGSAVGSYLAGQGLNIGQSLTSGLGGATGAGMSYLLAKEGETAMSRGASWGSGLGGIVGGPLGSVVGTFLGAMAGGVAKGLGYETTSEKHAARRERAAEARMLEAARPYMVDLAEFVTNKSPEEWSELERMAVDQWVEQGQTDPGSAGWLLWMANQTIRDPSGLYEVGSGKHERTIALEPAHLGSSKYNPFVDFATGMPVAQASYSRFNKLNPNAPAFPSYVGRLDPHTDVGARIDRARLDEMPEEAERIERERQAAEVQKQIEGIKAMMSQGQY